MKKFILIAFAAFAALVSCTKELDSPEPGILGTVTFKASIVETKTHLGDKEGTTWPNYWSEGDYLCVNGVNSTPLDASFDGKASAEFTVEGVASPYYAIYPGYLVSDYAAGAATINLPDEQGYVDGSYDPDAYIMVGKTTNESLALVPQVAIFSITPTGTGTRIKSVSLTSLGGKKIAGAFTTDFESITAAEGAKSTVTVSSYEGIDLGEPWMIVIPAADFTEDGIKVVIVDEDGGVMTRTTKPTKAYVAGKMYSTSIPYAADPLSLTAAETSSSSLVFEWGCGNAEADAASAYTVALYREEACSNLVVSYSIPADYGCWYDGSNLKEGNRIEPKLVIGGLAPSTTYYCKVTNTTKNETSDVVASTTDAFTPVDAQAVINASVGDVLLAEDFSEVGWGPDEYAKAAGYYPNTKNLVAPTGELTTETGGFTTVKNTGSRLFGSGVDISGGYRVSTGWGFFGNSSVFLRNGYMRVAASNGRTHIVTPALSGIPAGKYATIDVTATVGKYEENDNDIAVFVEGGLTLNGETEPSSASFRKYTGAALSDGVAFGVTTGREWVTKTVRVHNVQATDQLVIGSLSNIDGKNRFFISDVKVELVALDDAALIVPSCIGKSSSTLAFSWSATGDSAQDVLKSYLLSLSTDAEGNDEVVAYFIEPEVDPETSEPIVPGCWKDANNNVKATKFVFGGLDPSTTYYFHVMETDSGKESARLAATTDAFNVVDPTTVSNAGVGDVILAEDFSEIGWGADEFNMAGGVIPKVSTKELFAPTGDLSSDEMYWVAYNSTAARLFGDTKVTSDKRLFDWGFFGNSAVYAFSGYVRVSTTSSGSRTHIVSPALAGIPAGKVATIDVTVTSCKNEANTNDVAVFIDDHTALTRVLDPDQSGDSNFSGSGGKFNGVTFGTGYPLEAKSREWTTKTVRIPNVKSNNCLVIGSYTNVDTKNRFCLSDVKVEIVELKEPGAVDEEMDVYDFNTLKTFLTKSASGIVVGANVTADIALSSAEEAEIADLYPIAGYTGKINGGNHTISGLTKPFIGELIGEISNLTVESAINITESQSNVGILACSAVSSKLTGCTSKGSVALNCETEIQESISIGGLVGLVDDSTLENCSNTASVSNSSDTHVGIFIGGLVGQSVTSTYVACSNSGAVSNTGFAYDSLIIGDVCIAGLVGYLNGTNILTGTAEAYNSNSGTVTESSTTAYVCMGGVAAVNYGSGSDLSYAKNLEAGDLNYEGNSRKKSYIGGVLGAFKLMGTMDNASNAGDINFSDITVATQIWIGGVLGCFHSDLKSTSATFRNLYNSGKINSPSGNLKGGSSTMEDWSYIGGISGVGNCTNKTFLNCGNEGEIYVYTQVPTYLGGVLGYTNINPTGCWCHENIRYVRQKFGSTSGKQNGKIGGVVGYINVDNVHDLSYEGTLNSNSSSPNCFTGGIVGQIGDAGKGEDKVSTFKDCRFAGTVKAAGSDYSNTCAGLFSTRVSGSPWNFTFIDCVVRTGSYAYAIEITSENVADWAIGRYAPTSIDSAPTVGAWTW